MKMAMNFRVPWKRGISWLDERPLASQEGLCAEKIVFLTTFNNAQTKVNVSALILNESQVDWISAWRAWASLQVPTGVLTSEIRNQRNVHHYWKQLCITWRYVPARGSSVNIETDYGLDDRVSIPDRGRGFFFQPLRPDWLWGLPSFLSNG
jgi:hypothetical protein